jgi:hypothetical protein
MIAIRPLVSLCSINEIKIGCMHLFDAEDGVTPFLKKSFTRIFFTCLVAHVCSLVLCQDVVWWLVYIEI